MKLIGFQYIIHQFSAQNPPLPLHNPSVFSTQSISFQYISIIVRWRKMIIHMYETFSGHIVVT